MSSDDCAARKCAWSPSGAFVAGSFDDATVRTWYAATGAEGPRFDAPDEDEELMNIMVTRDDSRVIVLSETQFHVWCMEKDHVTSMSLMEPASDEVQYTCGDYARMCPAHCEAIPNLAETVALGRSDGKVEFVHFDAGVSCFLDVPTHDCTDYNVVCVRFSPDGTRLAAVVTDERSHVFVFLWDIGTLEITHSFPVFGICNMAWSPDSRKLAIARDDSVDVFDLQVQPTPSPTVVESKYTCETLSAHSSFCAWSQDALLLVYQAGDRIDVRDAKTYEITKTIRVNGATDACLSPDSRSIVYAARNGCLTIESLVQG